jgi:uncharacterized protein YajQ (UPF0234 family)
MPTFDVVSKLDMQSVKNALEDLKRMIGTRYDFKGSGAEIEQTTDGILLRADSQQRVETMVEELRGAIVRKKLDSRILDPQKPEAAGGMTFRQLVKLRDGLTQEKAKEVVKHIKDAKMKAQASIQGDLVRVSGKKRDELQDVIALLRGHDFEVPLQYINFRD